MYDVIVLSCVGGRVSFRPVFIRGYTVKEIQIIIIWISQKGRSEATVSDKKNKLYQIDEIRLNEILLTLDFVRGMYVTEIEQKIDEIEDKVSELITEYGSED